MAIDSDTAAIGSTLLREPGIIRRTSVVDRRTTRDVGYRLSRSGRARGECTFGGGRRHAAMRKTRPRGIEAVSGDVMLILVACNPVRIPKRLAA